MYMISNFSANPMVESSLTWQEGMVESSLMRPDPVFLCGAEKRQTEKSGLVVHNLAMHNHACILIWDVYAHNLWDMILSHMRTGYPILIWDVYTHMGHDIVPYAYGISHTRMGRPISIHLDQYTHMGENM